MLDENKTEFGRVSIAFKYKAHGIEGKVNK
jgi:hypothetical protein